jgi:hypothetical protein
VTQLREHGHASSLLATGDSRASLPGRCHAAGGRCRVRLRLIERLHRSNGQAAAGELRRLTKLVVVAASASK